jgi:hypothetical protein
VGLKPLSLDRLETRPLAPLLTVPSQLWLPVKTALR